MKKFSFLILLLAASQVIYCAHTPMDPTESGNGEQAALAYPASEVRSPTGLAESPWTTWSREKGSIGGLLVLSDVRKTMLNTALHDPHISYSSYRPVDCSKVNTNFRSADGSCTDLSNPHVGASGVAFGRNVAPKYIVKNPTEQLMTPNPDLISKEFFTRDTFKPVPFLNMLAAVWIQFMNHDWLTHGRNSENNPHKLNAANGEQKLVERTKENRNDTNQYKSEFGTVFTNDVTHWWDASQLYGSNQEEQNRVRSFFNGRMKTVNVSGRELLPKNSNLNTAYNKQNQGYEVTGFNDNWWVGLSMLHTLFVKEHNAIATMLMQKHAGYNPKTKTWTWTNEKEVKNLTQKELDEQVFQTARLINSALMAKIHTVEWTPAILSNETLKKGMFANWYGIANPQTLSKFKILKNVPMPTNKTDWFQSIDMGYLMGGIVGSETKNYGVPFSITEEFTSVYRLHSLLPEALELKKLHDPNYRDQVALLDTRNDKSYAIMENNDLQDLFYSFGTQLPGQLVLNNFPKFMQNLTIPGHDNIDLGMIDIVRDRERGVPRYNQFRRAINLIPVSSYRDFFQADKPLDARQQALLEKFYKVYGKDSNGRDNVELIDLLVGTLAEEVRPQNFGFGETMFQIFILMASRRLMADRFFTEAYTKEIYTKSGLDWIDEEGTLSQVIVRHMPHLSEQVEGLETAFRPWNNEFRQYAK